MSASTLLQDKLVTLPSDQDASGRTFGLDELDLVAEVLRCGTLTSTKGTFVKRLEEEFASLLGVRHGLACASGSAAVHAAIAAIDPNPGDEIVTSPITDMGALAPILYQTAIPVFADVDPRTYNVTADSIEACLSERTKAIIVTHLFGNPCEMAEIMALSRARNIPVIEDCAQSYLASENAEIVGTIGAIGCFSLQQGKHITTGEGGLVTTNDDALARRMFLFINKAWGYGDPQPDHYFLGLNYRMSELQGAVGLAQLSKLGEVVEKRTRSAEKLSHLLSDLQPAVQVPLVKPQHVHTYWKYCLHVDPQAINGGASGMARLLKEKGIASAPRYIQKPAFMCQVFQEQRTFGDSRFPFTVARPEAVEYDRDKFQGTFAALDHVLVLPWNELYTDEHIDYIAASVREASVQLARQH